MKFKKWKCNSCGSIVEVESFYSIRENPCLRCENGRMSLYEENSIKDVITDNCNKTGISETLIQTVSELCELGASLSALTVALGNGQRISKRIDETTEEIADVENMVHQLDIKLKMIKKILGVESKVEEIRLEKALRRKDILESN